MFGSLLERPLVARDALERYPQLVSTFDKELDCCKLLYDQHVRAAEELGESRRHVYVSDSTGAQRKVLFGVNVQNQTV